jgi:hypothetical protein
VKQAAKKSAGMACVKIFFESMNIFGARGEAGGSLLSNTGSFQNIALDNTHCTT